MKKNNTVITALCISVVAHGAFFASSPKINLQGMRQVMDQTRRMFRLGDVTEEVREVVLFEDTGIKPSAIKMTQQGSAFDGSAFRQMMLEKLTFEDMSIDKKKNMMKEKGPDGPEIAEREKFKSRDMLKAERDAAAKEVAPGKRSLADRLISEMLVEEVVTASSSDRDPGIALTERAMDAPYAGQDAWSPGRSARFNPAGNVAGNIRSGARMGDYEDIGESLEVSLFTYEDPSNSRKYFKIEIRAKDGATLSTMPKNVIFLIDSSKSITEEKLAYIKEGVVDALGRLNPGDRFNVVAFRGDLVKFRDESVPVTEKTLGGARQFISQLEAVGQTDVANALLGIIKEPFIYDPSYIVLITDGRPTTGAVDSRVIIQQITRRNGMERPIFCFGGGRKVNRYLLDFISYQNRAWSRFAASTYDIGKEFDTFYAQMKDPLLLNVRYRLLGLDAEEIYPRFLSDFYRNKPFAIYGRFDDEKVFSMQLLGEMNGSTKEFIFEKELQAAEKGDESIAREWAFRKIYYLISLNTMGLGSPEKLRAEIDRLSGEYGIKTPYDIEDED